MRRWPARDFGSAEANFSKGREKARGKGKEGISRYVRSGSYCSIWMLLSASATTNNN